jgi:diguanylate cyclase (GGDEF)-like protein
VLFKPKRPQESLASEPADRAAPASADDSRDTLAAVLRTLGELALPTKAIPKDEFERACDGLARQLLTGLGAADDLRGDPRKLHTEVRSAVRRQRVAEAREYATYRDSSAILLSDLVAGLRRSLEAQEAGDTEIAEKLAALERAVTSGDLSEIQRVAASTATRIRDVLTAQRSSQRNQIDGLSEQLTSMRRELVEAQAQMRKDPLTDLLNRGAFDAGLAEAIASCRSGRAELTVFLLDLDHFKAVNDTHGHPAGDEVLRAVSRQLVRSFPRKEDLVARYGGEEFVALCRSVGAEHAGMLAERARKGIEKLVVECEDAEVRPTASIGYAVLRPSDDPASFVKRADEALYRAKAEGRNRAVAEEEP